MDNFLKLDQSHPRYARFFKKLVESEIDTKKEQEQVLNRIARNFHSARQSIKNRNVDLFAVKSVELLEDLLYKTHRDSKVERYAKDALSGIARRRGVLNGPGRERALQAFGRIMDLKLSYEEKQQQFFKGISAVRTSEGLADLLENLLDSEIMEKVADSRAVVEYDDGRMALVWIPDFETANKVGSHAWCISRSDGGEYYWNQHATGLNKCYMIVDRALPATHRLHQFAFHIELDGRVAASHDQNNEPIDDLFDEDFKQALKVTGARPYNRDDVLRSDNDSLLKQYIDHYGDPELLSKRILTADNPALELGERLIGVRVCATANLPASRRLVLTVARQCAKGKKGSVISLPFIQSLGTHHFFATDSLIAEFLVAMMPSVAAAKKHCTPEVLELAQNIWVKDRILESAIEFGNRSMIASLIKNSWARPAMLDGSIKVTKILELGAKTNRLLLDSGFSPEVYEDQFLRGFLFPSSKGQRESAEVYFSDQTVQRSLQSEGSLCRALERAHQFALGKLIYGCEFHSPLLANVAWRLENLKRVLGENSELYAKQIGGTLYLIVDEDSAKTAFVHYLPQVNLLLDEVDRLKKEASEKTIKALGRRMCDRTPIDIECIATCLDINLAQQSLSEDGRVAIRRLAETMRDFGADIPLPSLEG